jgi:hypothetical protein
MTNVYVDTFVLRKQWKYEKETENTKMADTSRVSLVNEASECTVG